MVYHSCSIEFYTYSSNAFSRTYFLWKYLKLIILFFSVNFEKKSKKSPKWRKLIFSTFLISTDTKQRAHWVLHVCHVNWVVNSVYKLVKITFWQNFTLAIFGSYIVFYIASDIGTASVRALKFCMLMNRCLRYSETKFHKD